jgi:hypothetical protein
MQTQTILKENTDLFLEYLINLGRKVNLSEIIFYISAIWIDFKCNCYLPAGLRHHNTPMVLKI